MSGNFENLEFETQEISRRYFLDKEIGISRFDIHFETEAAKKFAIGDHRTGQRMTTDLATEPAFNFRNILDVIDMAVSQEQQFRLDVRRDEPVTGAVRRVEKNPTLRSFEQIAVRLKKSAPESFVSHGRGITSPGAGPIATAANV